MFYWVQIKCPEFYRSLRETTIHHCTLAGGFLSVAEVEPGGRFSSNVTRRPQGASRLEGGRAGLDWGGVDEGASRQTHTHTLMATSRLQVFKDPGSGGIWDASALVWGGRRHSSCRGGGGGGEERDSNCEEVLRSERYWRGESRAAGGEKKSHRWRKKKSKRKQKAMLLLRVVWKLCTTSFSLPWNYSRRRTSFPLARMMALWRSQLQREKERRQTNIWAPRRASCLHHHEWEEPPSASPRWGRRGDTFQSMPPLRVMI